MGHTAHRQWLEPHATLFSPSLLNGGTCRFIQETQLLLADDPKDINLTNARFDYLWQIGSFDLFDGMHLADTVSSCAPFPWPVAGTGYGLRLAYSANCLLKLSFSHHACTSQLPVLHFDVACLRQNKTPPVQVSLLALQARPWAGTANKRMHTRKGQTLLCLQSTLNQNSVRHLWQ